MSDSIDPAALAAFWRASGLDGPQPQAWSFGDTATMADALLDLVLRGIKTATASASWEYEAEGEPLPEPGERSIVADATGVPRAVIETTEVTITMFSEVGADHAWFEGEGDRSLEYWRSGHADFFRRTLAPIGRSFTPEMPVVLERFTLLYPGVSTARPTAEGHGPI